MIFLFHADFTDLSRYKFDFSFRNFRVNRKQKKRNFFNFEINLN